MSDKIFRQFFSPKHYFFKSHNILLNFFFQTAMSMCAIPSSPRRGRQTTSASYGNLGWLTVLILLTSTGSTQVNSQYSSHCHFNQLCSCRIVPVKRHSHYGGGHQTPPSGGVATPGTTHHQTEYTTNRIPTYTGQFGIILPEE